MPPNPGDRRHEYHPRDASRVLRTTSRQASLPSMTGRPCLEARLAGGATFACSQRYSAGP